MQVRRALVVFKKSAYQIYVREHGDRRIAGLVRRGHPAARNLRASDAEQQRSNRIVARTLEKLGIEFRLQYRAGDFRAEGFDLVISVGGDGTFIEASHAVGSVPLLGINSSPSSSVGYLTAATVEGFEEVMRALMRGRVPIAPLQRMRVRKDGRPVGVPVLNDVLFSTANPAATSRYILQVGGRREAQKSSGIWISTAAGSTAALKSAGGRVLPPRSRKIAYLVREPYHDPGRRLRLTGGAVSPGTTLSIVSRLRQSALYLDGSHIQVDLEYGSEARFEPHPVPLRAVGFRRPS